MPQWDKGAAPKKFKGPGRTNRKETNNDIEPSGGERTRADRRRRQYRRTARAAMSGLEVERHAYENVAHHRAGPRATRACIPTRSEIARRPGEVSLHHRGTTCATTALRDVRRCRDGQGRAGAPPHPGTTGKPDGGRLHPQDIDADAVVARSIRAAGGRPGGHGACVPMATACSPADWVPLRCRAAWHCTVIPMSGGHREADSDHPGLQAEHHHGDAIHMLTILDEMEAQGIDPKGTSLARVGIFGAEPWTPAMRTAVEGRRHRRGRYLRPVGGDGARGGQ